MVLGLGIVEDIRKVNQMSERIIHTPKLHSREYEGSVEYIYWCPGCKCCHSIPTPRWSGPGDINSPTFAPSVRHFIPAGENRPEKTTCHYHIQGGKIAYCNDCDHKLNGQTVDMADIPETYHT